MRDPEKDGVVTPELGAVNEGSIAMLDSFSDLRNLLPADCGYLTNPNQDVDIQYVD
jgi:hypothetical protein